MDYYQGVVEEYLRADRSVFVNPEFCLQLVADKPMPEKGTMWFVDLLAVDLGRKTAFLCEVTYSNTMAALVHRLAAWANHWDPIGDVLARDANAGRICAAALGFCTIQSNRGICEQIPQGVAAPTIRAAHHPSGNDRAVAVLHLEPDWRKVERRLRRARRNAVPGRSRRPHTLAQCPKPPTHQTSPSPPP